MNSNNGFINMAITVVLGLVIVGVVLVPIIDSAANGGGNGGGGGGGSGTVSVPAGLINPTYVSEAVFMSDQIGFEAITDTDITGTFPLVDSPIIGDDTTVRFGRCEAFLVDDTSYATIQGGTSYQAILSYSIYTGGWTIDSSGTWDVTSWSMDATGHLTPTYTNGKGSNMPDTYKVEWLWYDAETGNYHDMGGMIVGLTANDANPSTSYSLVNKGQYIGIFDSGFYDSAYGQTVPITYVGPIGDDWTIDIEYDVYDSVTDQVYHREKNVSLNYDTGTDEIPIISYILDEENGLAVVETNMNYRGVFSVAQTVDGPGGFKPVTISYQEIYDTIVNEEWENDYLGLFELEDGLIDGKIYSYIIAKVGEPKYIVDWDDDVGYIITPAGTFERDDLLITFDNGYGIIKSSDEWIMWEFASDIQFYGDTQITWYDPDLFVRGTFDATYFPLVGSPRNQQSNVENYASVGTFTPDPNGDYLMFDTNDGVSPTLITPSSWLNIADPQYNSDSFAYLYMAKNGGMYYFHETAENYDSVESYFHLTCPWRAGDTGALAYLTMSNSTYVIPMTLGYYVYDTEYDPSDAPVQVSESRSANATADSDSGNNGGMSNTLLAIVPVFLVLGILIYVVQYFRENKGF